MSGSNANILTNPAVPNNNEVDTLLIEKFNGVVHGAYQKGENLLSDFPMNNPVGTNMISNKSIGETSLQALAAGQEPEATDTDFNKNAFVVDTTILARNTLFMLHDVQNDFKAMEKLGDNQVGKLHQQEDQMVIQQLLAGGFTGGVYAPTANTITGGVQRASGHGVAIKVELNTDDTQAADPYQLLSAIQIAVQGLIAQRTPLKGLKILVPLNEFSVLDDFGFIAMTEGGDNQIDSNYPTGRLKGWNIPIKASTEYTQMKMNPHDGETHSLLSNVANGNRYDVTADMQVSNAIVYGPDSLLAGKSIDLTTDIFFSKLNKTNYVDAWYAEGCIYDRYDQIAIVASTKTGDNTDVLAKAKAKSKATKVYA